MLDNLDSKQKKILIIVGIVIIIGIIFFIYNKDSNDEKILDENILIEANTEMEENTIKDTENEQIRQIDQEILNFQHLLHGV